MATPLIGTDCAGRRRLSLWPIRLSGPSELGRFGFGGGRESLLKLFLRNNLTPHWTRTLPWTGGRMSLFVNKPSQIKLIVNGALVTKRLFNYVSYCRLVTLSASALVN